MKTELLIAVAAMIGGGVAEASNSFLLNAEIARCGGGGSTVSPEMQRELKERLALRAFEACGNDAVKLDSDFMFSHDQGPGDCEAFQELFRAEARFQCVPTPVAD